MEIDDDSFIIVAEARCRYKKPARFDDVLLIRTRVTQSQRRTLRFGYEILHQDSGELLATGETMHVICDHRGRPKSLPEKYRAYFPATPAPRDEQHDESSPVSEDGGMNVATTVARNIAEDVAEDPA